MRRAGEPALRFRVYEPRTAARGAVFATPGFSEHLGRYEHVCRAWRERGYVVANWDLRGQGRSEGKRGFVERFDDFVEDALALLAHLEQRFTWHEQSPPIAFGHSLGALVTIATALRAPSRFRALALTSPYLGLALKTPAWKKAAGRLLNQAWPTFSQPTEIGGHQLTHEKSIARAIDDDPLGVRHMTARMFTEIEHAQERVLAQAGELTLPVHCIAAGDDLVVDLEVTKRFMAALGSSEKQLSVSEGHYHELHQETDREAHIDRLAEHFDHWYPE